MRGTTDRLLFNQPDPLVFEQRIHYRYCRMHRIALKAFMGNPFTASRGYFVKVEGFGDMPEECSLN